MLQAHCSVGRSLNIRYWQEFSFCCKASRRIRGHQNPQQEKTKQNKIKQKIKQKQNACSSVMLSSSLNPTLLFLQSLHSAVAESAQRTLARVVWCLGSLRLLEPSRITQTMPVGCTPFLSFFSSPFFYLFLTPPSLFPAFSLKHPHRASVFTICVHFSCALWSLIFLCPPSLSPAPLPPPSLYPSLPLCLKHLLVEQFFSGLPKGAQGERKL